MKEHTNNFLLTVAHFQKFIFLKLIYMPLFNQFGVLYFLFTFLSLTLHSDKNLFILCKKVIQDTIAYNIFEF